MPLYKFKSFEDARQALWNYNPDAEYFRRIAQLFKIGFKLAQPVCRRGIFTFRNIDEANAFNKHLK
jgi:hypothetical protein